MPNLTGRRNRPIIHLSYRRPGLRAHGHVPGRYSLFLNLPVFHFPQSCYSTPALKILPCCSQLILFSWSRTLVDNTFSSILHYVMWPNTFQTLCKNYEIIISSQSINEKFAILYISGWELFPR